ncbi:uncharacterized protein HMPREF1541_05496 [Cyphellophora europaea CBS 101466]|uniref:TauD/TfdA-like domain-containing protein n=1 Tax=Cyphellophora europaea (strain CBS 101466) TaxID=1220924 RepID=W2RU26_CYPE1|nr:uncharacterized protein HMPREF1541_05496 [Cyphellophora europaea CBS 101466]ETN39273.1 hypothetical protein HMPREF1541_05496 [Cyphellophora europaea CBS 101466]
MAPAVVEPDQQATPSPPGGKVNSKHVDLSIFPDGIKTSGQHDPIYDQIAPYSAFPKAIPTTAPTYWEAPDYAGNPSLWQHPLSSEELASLSAAADDFMAQDLPLTAISPANFRLTQPFKEALASMRNELLNGKGFLLYKGFPVNDWGVHKSGVAYFGLGSHLGLPVSQNGKGHILGHVKDLGDDAGAEETRIYRTTARQFFHADECDIVGLLCLARAMEGGESDISSSHRVWNVLQQERPDVAELLAQPIWYFDRKGEVSKGQAEWIRAPVYYLETAADGKEQRVYSKWDPYYVRSLTRYSDKGVIPPLSAAQLEAIDVLEVTCQRVALHMVLEVGDIQFVANSHVFHARTAYTDHAPYTGKPRRHLMRLWLATSEDEGGWRLPFPDSKERKRGGIQVDDQAPAAKLDAD